MRKTSWLITLLILALLAATCGPGTAPSPTAAPTPTPQADLETLTLMSHDSFAASEDVIAQFEAEHNVKLKFLKAGDTGSALNQACLAKDNPLADVFFGVDNTFFSRAIDCEIFEAYEPAHLGDIADWFELDPQHRLNPVDYGDVCLNYDRTWFVEHEAQPPQSLEDLTRPELEGLTVVENPATSSPGLAFMLATIGHFGTEGNYTWLDFWADLRDNGLMVTEGWEAAYYGQFTAASDGDRPVVVSYASSPPAEVFFAEEDLEEAPTASVIGSESCFRQIEFVGVLKGTEKPELARALVDFLLSPTFQEDVPLNMFVFPVNENAELPEVFVKYAQLSDNPAEVAPDAIDQNRDQWIEQWTDTVLR